MMGKTHKVGGATSGVAILSILNLLPVTINPITIGIPFLAGNVIGSLIPDIDHKDSTISKMLWFIAIPVWILQSILNLIFRNSKSKLAKGIKSTVNHRGFAHWPSVYILFILIISIFLLGTHLSNEANLSGETIEVVQNVVASTSMKANAMTSVLMVSVFSFLYGLCFGALNHILLDSFNPSGVPLLAPISFKKIHFANVVTGMYSPKERIFRVLLILVLLGCIILYVYTSGGNLQEVINTSNLENKVDLINSLTN